MTMVFLAVPAIRLALSVPLDLRANWIFRMAEDVDGRAEVADAERPHRARLAVALPIALIAPLQWWVMGPRRLAVLLVEAAIGWLLVEFLMADWHRVPFTCSYIPGKGFVPQMCVKAFASYVTFTFATRPHAPRVMPPSRRRVRCWRRSSASPPRRCACAGPVTPGRRACCSKNSCRPT